MNHSRVSGHFIDSAKGPVFTLLRRPTHVTRATVLVVPPFAEEMNKCRRMVTETALGLVDHGYATVCPDLFGTGDSGGDFAAADWTTWQADLASVSRWYCEMGFPVTHLLAIRLGAALVRDAIAAGQIPAVRGTAFWQPVFDGGRFLTQFLRLRTAASLMDDRKETVKQLRGRLQQGEIIDVAGYAISRQLSVNLDAIAPIDRLPAGLGDTAWFEASRDTDSSSANASKRVNIANAEGTEMRPVLFSGEPFWASTEIVINREMISKTIAHFMQSSGPRQHQVHRTQ